MASDDPASLQNLHPIVEPAAVSWWPPAPGWYVLVAVAMVLLGVGAWRLWRQRRDQAYRQAALAEFAALAERASTQAGATAALREVPDLLKRTALAVYRRERVAALSGDAWWEFLDASAGIGEFAAGAGALLDRVAYDPGAGLDGDERRTLLRAAETWLRRHRKRPGSTAC